MSNICIHVRSNRNFHFVKLSLLRIKEIVLLSKIIRVQVYCEIQVVAPTKKIAKETPLSQQPRKHMQFSVDGDYAVVGVLNDQFFFLQ